MFLWPFFRRAPGARPGPVALLSLLLVSLLLAGCGGVLPFDLGTGPAPVDSPRAKALSAEGRHQEAAVMYAGLARSNVGIQRQRFHILAAREFRLAGDLKAAAGELDRAGQPSNDANRLLWTLVGAELRLDQGNTAAALRILDNAPPTNDRPTAAHILRLRAIALYRAGEPAEATRILVRRENWLDDADAIDDNRRLIWEGLTGADPSRGQPPAAGDPLTAGWIELAAAHWQNRGAPGALRRAVADWETRYPDHPAAGIVTEELAGGLRQFTDVPTQIALLLPLSGRQAPLAGAIRDGLLAAYFDLADLPQRPLVRVYDTVAEGAVPAYQRAVAEGADFVVGPLLKSSVQALAETGVQVPTLALNYPADGQPAQPGLYHFALLPEDEALAAAERALRKDHRRALALLPDNAWGRRMLDSFRAAFEGGGGRVVDFRFYDTAARDYSGTIRSLLLLDQSDARYRRLAANLNTEMDFDPRRRRDVDVIFLATMEKDGKLLRPQLRFHYASRLPTYSTSAVYEPASGDYADLDGIWFTDMPWILQPGAGGEIRSALTRHRAQGIARYSRFYALGHDAYRLIPLLHSASGAFPDNVPGLTGDLYMDDAQRIHRRLAWGRFRGGRVRFVESPQPPVLRIDAGEIADSN